MTNNKINITSTALEKGIDIAKDFLDKLIIPTVEESGLLLREKVTVWRFKNQVKILNKAKEYCELNGISPKTISLKILCPLLDNSALEEDEVLQDKWAILLTNLIDSDQNIENHVFPYILGQISKDEFLFLENGMNEKNERNEKLRSELEELKNTKSNFQIELESINKILETKNESELLSEEVKNFNTTKQNIEWQIKQIEHREFFIKFKISERKVLDVDMIRDFEVSNLTRLGLIKINQITYANSQTLEIPNDRHSSYLEVDLDIEVESDNEHIMTELGELFILACTEKKKQYNY